jgi:acyl carrier protein
VSGRGLSELEGAEENMTADEIRTKVKQAVAKVTGIAADSIDDAASYKTDLGLDSLSILEIAVEAESAFGIRVPEEELAAVQTVEDTVQLVARHRAMAAVCSGESLSLA